MRHNVLSALLVLSCLAGCGPRPEEPENASGKAASTAAGTADAAPAAAPSLAKIWFVPAAIEDCSPPNKQVAEIHWDASKSTAKTVDVKVVGTDGIEVTFATAGLVGSKVSGPWMAPGSVVVVRDNATGVELGRTTAESTPCTH